MLSQASYQRRQDLQYLKALASGANRHLFEGLPEREAGGDDLKREWLQLGELLGRIQVDTASSLDLSFLEESASSWPVCGLMHNGVPLHPPGVNQTGGAVNVTRSFGGIGRDQTWVMWLLTRLSADELAPYLGETVYTRGTAAGFEKRLREQCTRKCVSVLSAPSVGGAKPKQAMSRQAALRLLGQVLPVDASRVPDLREELFEQIGKLKFSKVSNCGAPYWKPKQPLGMVQALEVGIPLIFEKLQRGELTQLMQEQPELFLASANNKLDRYEVAKLGDKTRPYFQLPLHWQALFSCLSQPFTHALKLFHESDSSMNAYGMSWANGGGQKLYTRVSKLARLGRKGGRPFAALYGDDADVYYRDPVDGRLMRICPDFRQMDGSVDADCISLVVDYVVETMLAAHPGAAEECGPFWREVGRWWKHFASNPHFVVQGTGIYRKKSGDGLMSGVVGTTLFDTAKSAFAYSRYFEQLHDFKRYELLEEAKAIQFFKSMGLEIKAGTWKPHPVREDPAPGELWSEGKFLGVQLIWVEGAYEPELVPYLGTEDWLKLLTCPRDDPGEKVKSGGGPGARSRTANHRIHFDRLRGYLITGGFSNEWVRKLLYAGINDVPPEIILMAVQSGNGKGEPPEMHQVVGGDFEYPTSDGVPSELWCRSLYLTEGNKFPPEIATWDPVFPDLVGEIQRYRKEWKSLKPKMAVIDVSEGDPFKGGRVVASQVSRTFELPQPVPAPSVPEMAPGLAEPSKGVATQVRPRSTILDVQVKDEARVEVPQKRLPTSAELLERIFRTATPVRSPRLLRGEKPDPVFVALMNYMQVAEDDVWASPRDLYSSPILLLADVADRLGCDIQAARRQCAKNGFLVLGGAQPLVTKVPLVLTNPRVVQDQVRQLERNKSYAGVVSKTTASVREKVNRAQELPASPPSQVVVSEHWSPPPLCTPSRAYGGADPAPWPRATFLLQSNSWVPRAKTRQVQIDGQQYAETRLSLEAAQGTHLDLGLTDPVEWLVVVGPNSRDNLNRMGSYILTLQTDKVLNSPKNRAAKKREAARAQVVESVRPKLVEEGTPSFPHGEWAAVVENERLAKMALLDETPVMVVKGNAALYNPHIQELAPGWAPLEKDSGESLSQFMLRVKTALRKSGIQARFTFPPRTEPNSTVATKNGPQKQKEPGPQGKGGRKRDQAEQRKTPAKSESPPAKRRGK